MLLSPGSARPNPEQFLELIRRQERGRLKVYLGSAVGVGKTYAMLREGQRLKKQGLDVVIGLVETHGRSETAEQSGNLDVVPPRTVEHRGVTLREMDLAAILARRPTVCLVDELAHTNSPGSRYGKRYQDVEELLKAGIHVITSVNVQHLESLYEQLERATGIRVKERLPDSFLRTADQIVNVDVSAEDLRERLEAGKIYAPERVERALENFFTPAKLTRLREITLKVVAQLIDRRDELGQAQPSAAERVMVGLSSHSPDAEALLYKRAASVGRIALPSSPRGTAVYVQTPAEGPTKTGAVTERIVSTNLELARQLGGTPMQLEGTDAASALVAFAREHDIKVILLGKSLPGPGTTISSEARSWNSSSAGPRGWT